MSSALATYNERSWAIDLIGYLKHISGQNNRTIKDAGGEQTIRTEVGSLFPDVLLFGDRATARILQGWELKMPDTSIDDHSFRDNAEQKARALGLDSFLLWNVCKARLYVRDPITDQYSIAQEWSDLSDVVSRTNVVANRKRWQALADEIVSYLNDLFDGGLLEGRQFIDAYRSGGVTALIMENSDEVAEALVEAGRCSSTFKAEMVVWWDRYQAEYGGTIREQVLAQAVISNWIGKIIFSHILREQDHRAQQVSSINDQTSPTEALALFEQLSRDCNFWTIFSDSLGLSSIPSRPWDHLKQFNRLLTDLRVGSIDQTQLSGILEATVEVAVRKLRGQYPTPIELARLLVSLCVKNTMTDRILDPCCGSGTIARAALEQKLEAGVSPHDASAAVFAGDQDPQAVQISTFALAKPGLMHVPLRVFQKDAFSLQTSTAIVFRNPTDGSQFAENIGEFNAITSNLPFVAQAGRQQYGNAIHQVTSSMAATGAGLSGRADVAAYLPFALHPLLKDGGKLGIIITNAWLGTDWGDAFYGALARYYDLKSVITSGAGRWFQNSEVVANILIMEKKTQPDQPGGNVRFVVLMRPLVEMGDDDTLQLTAAQIEIGQSHNETMTIREVSPADLDRYRLIGLGGNAQFVNCDWVLDLPLVPLRSLFAIRRGERRGLNALFYPTGDHKIEPDYIRPLVKSPTDFKRLATEAAREAFTCSRTEQELEEAGHIGALNWIKRFKTDANIKKLRRSELHWHEMRAEALADLVIFINYGDRLFVGRVDPPAFVDQRMVPLEPLNDLDVGLCHALMNSAVGLFMIEGLGFGRGLGALDLNKDRMENYLHILDPAQLSAEQSKAIKDSFAPLLSRDIMCVADELEESDRQAFDDVIIQAFGIKASRLEIYNGLLSLVEIRSTAND